MNTTLQLINVREKCDMLSGSCLLAFHATDPDLFNIRANNVLREIEGLRGALDELEEALSWHKAK